MKFQLLILAITAFFIYDTYKDNAYSSLLKSYRKYYKMAGIGFVGLSLLYVFKNRPTESHEMVKHATNMIKYLPIDKESIAMLDPIFSFGQKNQYGGNNYESSPQFQRMMNSGHNMTSMSGSGQGTKATKRSVSETKKKFVASRQDWKCNKCGQQLPAWFEVDHVVRLEHGGSNHVDNLVALCRNCHGEKTAMESM